MKKLYEMKFNEEIKYTPGKMPTLLIDVVDPEGKTIATGYLTPFRKYRFQVSGSMEGDGDFGSTQVIPFSEFATLPRVAIAEILRSLAAAAVTAFAQSGYIYRHIDDEEYAVIPADTSFGWIQSDGVWYKYIKEVYTYLYPELKWPFIE